MTNLFSYLKTLNPFNLLPEEILHQVAADLQEHNYNKNAIIYRQDTTPMKGIDIIVSGSYESFFYDSSQNKRVIEEHGPDRIYGGISLLLNRKKSLKTVMAKKGTRVLSLNKKEFLALCESYEAFAHHFIDGFTNRLRDEEFAHFFRKPPSFEESYIASDQLFSRKIETVEQRAVVSCTEDTPVYEAARIMAEHRVSCIFVQNHTGEITGYATDITLRDNVIAQRGDPAQPIARVMDNPIVTISDQAFVYEAILMMFRTKARYLLVRQGEKVTGFLSRNKLLAEQAQSPLVFIQSVKSAAAEEELKRKWEQVPNMVHQLLGRGVHAAIANQVITSIADTIAIKVIEKVIEEIGQPPARFVFMVLGSEGRKEQTLKTDQDNAIIYEDKANEQRESVREYFLRFATLVSEKLNHIGFSFCTGGFMAMNPKWTHSLSHWKRNYESWIQESIPENVIKFSTFFDCRYLYGDESIMNELQDFLHEELKKPQDKLFYFLAKNALQYKPPLTFFKNIRTVTKGTQEFFDLKKAMTPIVDLVRVYALKYHVFAVNTGERLKALKEKQVFTEQEYQELMQSYYLLMGMRLKKQSRQIIQDRVEPDNDYNPAQLSRIEQLSLIEIFKTIERFQDKIKIKFTNSLF